MIDPNEHIGVVKRYIEGDNRRMGEIYRSLQNEYSTKDFDDQGALIPTMSQSVVAVYRPCYVDREPWNPVYWYEFQGVRILSKGE